MIRYLISVLVFLAGFAFAVLLTGNSLLPLLDLPTFITVGLVPFLFVSVLFGFKEMKAAYTTALQKEPDADRVSKSLGFFNIFGATIWIMGMVSVIIGIIGMLQNLENRASIGPNMALSMLSIFYSGLLYLAAVFPFLLMLKKKRKTQPEEELA
jgi:flagellar motor component MotA